MKLYILSLLLIMNLFVRAQDTCSRKIIFIQFPINGINSKKIDFFQPIFTDTCLIRVKGSYTYKLCLFDCRGEGFMEIYKGKILISKQSYINSIDALKKYNLIFNPITLEESIYVCNYFEALINGVKVYYNKNGEVIKVEKYKMGVKVE